MGFNQHTRGTWINNLVYNIHLLTGKIATPGNSPFSLTGQPSACGTVREVGTLTNRLPHGEVTEREGPQAGRRDLGRPGGAHPGRADLPHGRDVPGARPRGHPLHLDPGDEPDGDDAQAQALPGRTAPGRMGASWWSRTSTRRRPPTWPTWCCVWPFVNGVETRWRYNAAHDPPRRARASTSTASPTGARGSGSAPTSRRPSRPTPRGVPGLSPRGGLGAALRRIRPRWSPPRGARELPSVPRAAGQPGRVSRDDMERGAPRRSTGPRCPGAHRRSLTGSRCARTARRATRERPPSRRSAPPTVFTVLAKAAIAIEVGRSRGAREGHSPPHRPPAIMATMTGPHAVRRMFPIA